MTNNREERFVQLGINQKPEQKEKTGEETMANDKKKQQTKNNIYMQNVTTCSRCA